MSFLNRFKSKPKQYCETIFTSTKMNKLLDHIERTNQPGYIYFSKKENLNKCLTVGKIDDRAN